jgi:hypothetical protein
MCSRTIVGLLGMGLVCWVSLPAVGSPSQWGHYVINQDDFHDSSGNDRDGTALDGAVTMFDTQRGWVADFTQSTQSSPRIQLGTEDPAASNELTISAWVRWFGSDGRWQGIAGKSFDTANRAWILQLQDTDGELCWPNGPTGVLLDKDRWVHVIVTFGQGTARVYVDGRKKYEASGVSLPQSGNCTAAHVTIGHAEDRTDAAQWFNGYLDDIYFFTKALSGAEAESLYEGTAPSFLKARNPIPAAGATGVTSSMLRWTAGDTAVSQKIYWGSSCSLGSAQFMGSVPASVCSLDAGALQSGVTYCWRVDEVDQNGTVITGDVWCFTAGAAAPVGGVVNPCCDPVLTWPPVPGAVAYRVYFYDHAPEVSQRSQAADQGTTTQTTLPLGMLQTGTTYYWCVDVISANGTVVAGAVHSFTMPICTPLGILREWWLNIPGTTVGDLLSSPRYAQPPDGHDCVDCLEGPTDWVDNYGCRLTTLLVPPVWGAYTFTVTGRDDARLFLSSDEQPGNLMVIIAGLGGPGSMGDSQKSAPLALQGGKKYFLQLLTKAGTGHDYMSVSWQRPDGVSEVICAPYVESSACMTPLAYGPHPVNGEIDVALNPVLTWQPGQGALQHDVYFGDSCDLVANATPLTCGVYKGRQGQTSFLPGALVPGVTYYWRIDEVDAGSPAAMQKGCVWTFTVTDCVRSIDDFESYGGSNPIGLKWQGTPHPVDIEWLITHYSKQSMRVEYDNYVAPHCSEARPGTPLGLNWMVQNATALSLWFHGRPPKFMETSPSSFVMSASGTDIWNTADEFRFACQTLSGDGSLVARVQRIRPTDGWAKAGVMIRESLAPGSKHAMAVVTPGNGVSFQRRLSAGGVSQDATQAGISAPCWLRLSRSGDKFSAEYSLGGTDGWHGFPGGSVAIAMSAQVYMGLAVTSHNPNEVTVAVFSHVSLSGSWQVADIGVPQPGNEPCPLYVHVEDTMGHAAKVFYPDNPYAVLIDDWRPWNIPLSAFWGVDVTHLKGVAIGLCDLTDPSPGAAGQLYIDDICWR